MPERGLRMPGGREAPNVVASVSSPAERPPARTPETARTFGGTALGATTAEIATVSKSLLRLDSFGTIPLLVYRVDPRGARISYTKHRAHVATW